MRVRTTALCIGLAALLGPAPAAVAPGEQEIKAASREAAKGDRAWKAGDAAHAKDFYSRALARAPGFPGALIGLGQIALAEGEFESALGRFQSAKTAFATYGEAMLDVQSRRYADARNEINGLQDSIRQLQMPTNVQQDASIRIGQLQNRISQLQSIEPPSPDSVGEPPAELDFYIGNALFRLKRIADAVAAWEACRDRAPEFPLVYNNLALVYGQLGRIDEALASLDRAEKLGLPVSPQFRADLQRLAH